MKRREFLGGCAALSGAAALQVPAALAETAPKLYTRARLIDIHGEPLKAKALVAETNYVFSYPFASTPCFLLKLAKSVVPAKLRRQDGDAYAWNGGVGPGRDIVAFSAICAHKLAYPTREVSFIRYQKEASATSNGAVIHCCADHSVYDPAGGARVVSGPAPQPLAAILLAHDPDTDGLFALGTVGAEQFEPFFEKYAFKLSMEYGPSKARAPVADTTVVRELADYCRATIRC